MHILLMPQRSHLIFLDKFWKLQYLPLSSWDKKMASLINTIVKIQK